MKSSCSKICALLESFLDGDLSVEEDASVAAHLQTCPGCRAEFESERLLRNSFTSLPELSCPETTTRLIEKATLSRQTTRVPSYLWQRGIRQLGWRPTAAGVAALAAIFLLLLYPTSHRDPETNGPYTREEILVARQEAKLGLILTFHKIGKSEKEAIGGVLGKRLPQAIRGSLQKVLERSEGGQG